MRLSLWVGWPAMQRFQQRDISKVALIRKQAKIPRIARLA